MRALVCRDYGPIENLAIEDRDDPVPGDGELVFDVKADGFFNLLKAAADLPIGATVCFSSVAGRFGNSGQTDYSAANDLLCKLTSSLRRWRPETCGIAIDWTAWAEIGMATRGSVPTIMKMAGIDLLPPDVGIPTVRRELTRSPGGEIVAGGELGLLVAEWDDTGGLDLSRLREAAAAGFPLPDLEVLRLALTGVAMFLYLGVPVAMLLAFFASAGFASAGSSFAAAVPLASASPVRTVCMSVANRSMTAIKGPAQRRPVAMGYHTVSVVSCRG